MKGIEEGDLHTVTLKAATQPHTDLHTCLHWIRYLRQLRRQGDFGTMERDALLDNYREARRLKRLLRRG